MATKKSDDASFTAEERAAMKERAAELKSTRGTKGAAKKEKEAQDLKDKIAELPDDERVIAHKVADIVAEEAPELDPKTWYGMPGLARDGAVIVFVQPASKFKLRYHTVGFNDGAALDDGSFWPTAYALTAMTKATEAELRKLVKKAVG